MLGRNVCVFWPLCVSVTGQDAEIETVVVTDPSVLAPADVSAVALDFKVLHPVVVTKLGVFSSSSRAELHGNMTVKLLQLDQEVIGVLDTSHVFLWSCFFFHMNETWRPVCFGRRPWSRLASAPLAQEPC